MYHINRHIFNTIPEVLYISCKTKTTHYEVLQLKKDCSAKEIKDSYIKLSKLYHPDRTESSKSCHQKFLKINEAYNTLSKPLTRRNYDLELERPAPTVEQYQNYQHEKATPVYEDTIFHRGAKPPREDEYYGFRGLKKQPHIVIVLVCIGIAVFGLIVQISLVKFNFMLRRDKLQRESEANELLLREVRKTSQLNSREQQIEIVRKRFEQEELERKKRMG